MQAQLMDMVQFSVSSGHVEWAQMAYLTVLNLLLSSFHDIYRYLAEISDSNGEVSDAAASSCADQVMLIRSAISTKAWNVHTRPLRCRFRSPAWRRQRSKL